ncbi:hypothetical protein NP493_174g01002 [Ridgeia piscesae]|uniref:Uncharacterized protein n=1 Tax=Ridgeia piscesae TaxID=27915 RepID=A0AAD9UF83_RIDPI|nr:hypothetical protein NP493_174g01002 [Ridgeia piscesae]
MFQIIQLEEKLRAEGKLKTQADVDEFWCTIRRPEVFKKYFLVTEQRTQPHAPVSQTPITMVATLSNPMQQAAQADAPASMKPMDRILDYWLSPTVDNLRDRVGHVTSQGKRTKSLVSPAPATTKKEDDPFHRARKAAAELDQKHPQMGIPRLNCFYMDLEEQQRDPEEALRELRNNKHSKERLLFAKRLHRMYSLANTNLASMQRILEKREEVDLVPFQAGCTVVSDLIPTQVIHSTPEPTVVECHNYRPWLKYIDKKREINPIKEVSEGGTGASERGTSVCHCLRCMSGERSVRVHMQDTVPICWESLVQEEDIKVMVSIKCHQHQMTISATLSRNLRPDFELYNQF